MTSNTNRFVISKSSLMPLLIITTIIVSNKNSMGCRRFNIGNAPLSMLVNSILSNFLCSLQIGHCILLVYFTIDLSTIV